jgi:hypothetical protein
MQVDEVSLVRRGADQDADVLLYKSAEGKSPSDDGASDDADTPVGQGKRKADPAAQGDQSDEDETITKRSFSTQRRQHDAAEGHANSDGSYPIETTGDLNNAAQAIGRAKNPTSTRRLIARRAEDLGVKNPLAKKGSPMTTELHPTLAKALSDFGDVDQLADDFLASLNQAFVTKDGEKNPNEDTDDVDDATDRGTDEGEDASDGPVNGKGATAGKMPRKNGAHSDIVGDESASMGKSAELVAMEKQLETIQKELDAARRTTEVRDLTERLTKEFRGLPMKVGEVADVFYRIGKGEGTQDDRDTLIGVLAAASNLVQEAGLFSEAGSTTSSDSDDPFGKLVAKALADDPKLTQAQAVSKAMETKEGRQLYQDRQK